MTGTSISIEDLTFAYPGQNRPALRHLRGSTEAGRFLVLTGHGGAGKSSLCYALNGLIPSFFKGDYQGRVLIQGREVAGRSAAQMSRSVGLVFQDFETQLFSTNVELELAFGPENLRLPRSEIERRVRHYLSVMGLEAYRGREPATLSGGEKQRLAIGSVLAMEPEILIMDEPATDLDPRGREEVLLQARLLREKGQTLLIVDPDPETAVDADEVWVMKEGQLLAQGNPSEILKNRSLGQSSGMHPHPLLELFQEMGWPGCPLTLQEAKESILKNRWVRQKKFEPPSALFQGTSRSPLVKVEELTYTYPLQNTQVLSGIDLQIDPGEFIALLGKNGSGKTTLAKQLNGLLRPTSGEVRIEGRPTTHSPRRELARKVGYVFQNPDHQIFSKTVREEVGFGLKMLGAPSGQIEKRVGEALEAVGLVGDENKMPFTLTKGERQRVAVASVLAVQPQMILLDEPTTGLDPVQQRGMMEMLVRLNRAGHTILIITHSMEVAAEYAGRTIVMKDGATLLDGPTRSVFFEEEVLGQASLSPPLLVRLSNWLGTQALTVRQLVKELKE